ncbi:hypothetical protein AAFX91_22400 [Bradyrhizobium sp. 31Argb]|uniref:hypothetical protein n=1 Tax=Bradyrhizobium sp. 31Argb TaxID=3141247 RepID=UPI003748200C
MDSLSSGPVAEVLKRLHGEAEAADAPLMQTYASEMTNAEQVISQVIEAETKGSGGTVSRFRRQFPQRLPGIRAVSLHVRPQLQG